MTGLADLVKERDQGRGDLARTLLLRPMAAARQHDRFRQLGDECFQVRDQLIHPREFDDEVAIPRHVKRRDGHLRPGEGREQLPVAVDVAIPVEAAAEACPGEFSRKEVDVRLCEPRGQRRRIDRAGEEAARSWDHAWRLIAERIVGLAWNIARSGIEKPPKRIPRITLKLRLGDARSLEIKLIEKRRVGLRHYARWSRRSAWLNGTLKPATARKRSGRRRAQCQATGAPQSWPTTTVCGTLSASSTPTMSPT